MNNDYSADLITLVDEEGIEHNFEIIDIYEENGTEYYALCPAYDNKADLINDSGEYFILEVIEEDGEEQLAEVVDEALRKRLSAIFEQRFEDSFYED